MALQLRTAFKPSEALDRIVPEMNLTINEVVTHCHFPNCSWLFLHNLTKLQNVPPLLPNRELSGIGVILGFSLSAYLTLALLILHYVTVHSIRRTNTKGKEHVNSVDRGILLFIRERIILWTPSRRFEYAMEKSVLILSDLNLVTELGILIAGYSQLDCGISAYHWQIMVFVAWFASFSFISAITFLEDYFQMNNNMRIIRVFFMFILASLLIAALLPTGSRSWLNQYLEDEQGFYPSLSTVGYYKQITMPSSFLHSGPKLWSMIFSVFVVAISYLHCGVRLFDPTAEITRKYFRTWPGSQYKRVLRFVERKSHLGAFQATFWHGLYIFLYSVFISMHAAYDIAESMLLEIIWLTFAMAWGTIKVWETRAAATMNYDGENFSINHDVLLENSWSFGQTLPLVLLLLPILSMAQAYLDNDAKAQEAKDQTENSEKRMSSNSGTLEQEENRMRNRVPEDLPDPRNSTSCSIRRCNHRPSLCPARTQSHESVNRDAEQPEPSPALRTTSPTPSRRSLPRYPYGNLMAYPWYIDHILLLLCQILMVTAFALWVLTVVANIFGISAILRNKLFLIWILAMVLVAAFVHLGVWYIASLVVSGWPGGGEWLRGEGSNKRDDDERWCGRVTVGQFVYWTLRLGLVGGCLMLTFFGSLELAGPEPLDVGA